MTKPPRDQAKIHRRQMLAGATAASAAAITMSAQAQTPARWDQEADVVVVGSGAAAGAAAAKALESGATVIVLEKAPIWGGTSAKSGAWYWIPNNTFMRADGRQDPREDALRYMARLAYPTRYRPDAERFGLTEHEHDLLATFYDRASPAIEDLARMGALQSQMVGGEAGPVFDYAANLSENKAPRGRTLQPRDAIADGGVSMTRQLRQYIASHGGSILLRHRATKLHTNAAGQVIGVTAQNRDGTVSIRARRGVVFGSGGFTHNLALRQAFLKGPIYGGCAVPTCEGDFVHMGTDVGAQLGNMTNAWWAECILEDALETPSFGETLFNTSGASMFYVNRFGRRVVDEHMPYNERTQVHFVWDPSRFEYINNVLFIIFDEATRTEYAGWHPIPPANTNPRFLLRADTLDALSDQIARRLDQLAPRIGDIALDRNFKENLADSNRRFAEYARTGRDVEFRRDGNPAGRTQSLFDFGDPASFGADRAVAEEPGLRDADAPHFTMRALADRGPYYAVLAGAGTLDTKGGPVINSKAQVLNVSNQPIEGLYGAGNCIASPAAQAYFAGGATLGLALTYGHIAGHEAARAPVK